MISERMLCVNSELMTDSGHEIPQNAVSCWHFNELYASISHLPVLIHLFRSRKIWSAPIKNSAFFINQRAIQTFVYFKVGNMVTVMLVYCAVKSTRALCIKRCKNARNQIKFITGRDRTHLDSYKH